MTIKLKLILSSISVVGLILAFLAISWLGSRDLAQTHKVGQELSQAKMYLQKALRGISENVINGGTPASAKIGMSGVVGFEKALDNLPEKLDDNILNEKIKNIRDLWIEVKYKTAPLLMEELDVKSDNALDDMEFMIQYGATTDKIDNILAITESASAQASVQAKITMESTADFLRLTALSILFVVLGIFFTLYRNVVPPIGKFISTIENMAEGDLSKRLETNAKDELAQLAVSFNRMTKRISDQTNALEEGEERYKTLVAKTCTGFVTMRVDGEVIYVNDPYAEMTGLFLKDKIIGRSILEWTAKENVEETVAALKRGVNDGYIYDFKSVYQRPDGSHITVLTSATTQSTPDGVVINAMCHDVTEKEIQARKIERLAYHDHLTGLPNRSLYNDRLNEAIIRSHRESKIGAVMFVDLDDFKAVNDTLGHETGDFLLKSVADRFTLSIRECDTVSRYGGDEFLLLIDNLNNIDEVRLVAEKVIGALEAPHKFGENEIRSGASMGISVFPDDGNTTEKIIKNADLAMYLAKEMGKNQYQFYNGIKSNKSAGEPPTQEKV